jgi:hypothetical protein
MPRGHFRRFARPASASGWLYSPSEGTCVTAGFVEPSLMFSRRSEVRIAQRRLRVEFADSDRHALSRRRLVSEPISRRLSFVAAPPCSTPRVSIFTTLRRIL